MIIETKCILVHNDDVELARNLGLPSLENEREYIVDFAFKIEDVSALRRDTDNDGNIDPTIVWVYIKSLEKFCCKDSYDKLLSLWKNLSIPASP